MFFDTQHAPSLTTGIKSLDTLIGIRGIQRGSCLSLHVESDSLGSTLLTEILSTSLSKACNTLVITDTEFTEITQNLELHGLPVSKGNFMLMKPSVDLLDQIEALQILSWPNLVISFFCNNLTNGIKSICEACNLIGIEMTKKGESSDYAFEELVPAVDSNGHTFGTPFRIEFLNEPSNMTQSFALSTGRIHSIYDLFSASVVAGILSFNSDGQIVAKTGKKFADSLDEAIYKISPIHVQARLNDAIYRQLAS
ncbi:hypothetical protein V6259_12865 [Marinomonas sp. TI.3.20]|uniref:hypothetical protein n=1 Tax=Marinomonas sp. TI.3.20 TaxID=3121296 RepID=UPI00312014DD